MHQFTTSGRIVTTCNRGLAPWLALELTQLGFQTNQTFNTGVELTGTLNDCIRLNLNLRCASQVMYSLQDFRCSDPDQLYQAVTAIPWEQILHADGYFTVNSNVVHPLIRSGMFANVKVKDAIVDRIRRKSGRRPDSGAELRGAVVYLFWRNEEASIFLDTSGETLAKHGYRRLPGKAPMVEALAAATILAGKWDRVSPFVNPMCGSGTVAIEAALIATNRFPGLLRTQYSFMHIQGFENKNYLAEQDRLKKIINDVSSPRILATDISREAIQIARTNAEAADVSGLIEFEVCDFSATQIPPGQGVVFFNPEYGERMGDETELAQTYSQIGDFLKQKCGGYWGYVFTGNLELAKKIGLKTKRRIEFSTAQMDCRLLEYELYAGSRRERIPVAEPGPSP